MKEMKKMKEEISESGAPQLTFLGYLVNCHGIRPLLADVDQTKVPHYLSEAFISAKCTKTFLLLMDVGRLNHKDSTYTSKQVHLTRMCMSSHHKLVIALSLGEGAYVPRTCPMSPNLARTSHI